MKPGMTWKLAVIGVVVAWSLFQAWPRPDRPFLNMRLGLDLKGGSHLVMEVQTDDAIKGECDIAANRLNDRLQKEGYTGARTSSGEVGQVIVTGVPAARLSGAADLAQQELATWAITTTADGLVAKMPSKEADARRDDAVTQALETIRNRVDALGVGETNIQRLGGQQKYRLLVELPGVEDPSRVKKILQTEAKLELRLAYYAANNTGPFVGETKEAVLQAMGGQMPAGVEILPFEELVKSGQAPNAARWMAVQRTSVITGSDLQNAAPSTDQWGQTVVAFQLKVGAVQRFSTFTRENVGHQMPIILDNKIKSAPNIQSEISNHGQITGSYTLQDAKDLALVLKAGALPARIVPIEERTVGPSLGKDSIDAGKLASIVAFVLVALFMVGYYRLAGINAEIALVLNLLILAAVMSTFGAVLTLPGIGGYALTVGIAVDANVLVFERIREEIRGGRTVKAALDAGFSKALATILDTHVTTIVSGLFLFQYGTGPVRGFAVSLIIGLLANLFTAVFVSRVIFDLMYGDKPVKQISI